MPASTRGPRTAKPRSSRFDAAKRSPALSDLERQVLAAQAKAYYSVFRIEEVLAGSGVHAEDGYTGESFFLMDASLSESEGGEGYWIASWLVSHGAWKMTTGAPAMLGPLDSRVVRETLGTMFDDVGPTEEAKRAAALAFTSLGLSMIEAADTGGAPPLEPFGSLAKEPGRNHPCPCGSRVKYKYCCRP